MKIQFRIILITISVVLILAILLSLGAGGIDLNMQNFAASFGIIAVIAGTLYILVGIIILIAGQKEWAQGFLIAGGILLITGFATCSLMIKGSNGFH